MCYKCNSSEIEKCATEPGLGLPIEECAKDQISCITRITENGHVIRDCTDGNHTEIIQPFDICNSTLCNRNIFPADRLMCYNCEGEDCFQPTNKYFPQICPIYRKNDKCFTQIIDEIDAVRGCASSHEFLPPFAVTCLENGCNREPGLIEYNCLECNSVSDKNCKSISSPIKKCNFTMLLGRTDPTCFTYHKNDNVIRGCYRDSGKLGLEEDFFKACNGEECNNKIIPVAKCVVCGPGTSDPNCEKNKIEVCEENISSCYSCLIKSNNYQRGCGIPLLQNNDKNISCYECQNEDGCNTKPFRKCYNCNSKTNPNCAGHLNLTNTEIEICQSSNASCLTTVNGYGHTERGCLSEKFNTTHKVKVEKCFENLCNSEIFPTDRLQCFRCSGNDDCSLKQEEDWAEPCEIYEKQDGCFEFIKNDKQIFRGCKTDPEFKNCTSNQQFGCHQCLESRCNNITFLLKKSERSCYVCDKNDKSCKWSQEKTENLKFCKRNVPLNAEEQCYSYKSNNGEIKRGCVLDDEICSNGNNENCTVCNTNECNNKLHTSEKCIQIDLENDGVKKLERTFCTAEKQTYNTRGCYAQRKGISVKLGCICDLTTEQIEECRNNPKTCYMCTDNDCDNMKIPEREGKSPILSCYKCNDEDEHCRWRQNKFSMPCKHNVPQNASESCFVRKDSQGKIERGCSYDRNLCINSDEEFCKICNENDCNNEVLIPQECIQEKYKNNEKKENELKPSTCENPNQYWTNQGCYVRRDENNDIVWGCIVDLNEDAFVNCTVNEKCNHCIGKACSQMKVPSPASKLYSLGSIGIVLVFCLINIF
ncbi:uncharacterized protein LOC129608402 [Condylostylus longicornis]|uniref:uncharacterized protein LOC129608402 n=1 Tax=Condylostylus longicornis TaxID=2530218 RepID=UPI00244DAE3B|nr:uncharacterized protein LOC129608402 [Condylostylus longicornis]